MDTTTDSMSTDGLRRDIAARREEVGRDLEVIGDRVSPARMADRTRERTRRRAVSLRDRVMGPAQGAASSIGQSLSGDHDPAGEVARRVEGRPVAMGLVAFGVGFVAGSILPASRTERDLAHQVEPQVGRAIQGAVSTAQEAGEHLAPAARDEAAALKDEASAAASNVADRGRGESEGTTLPQPPQPSQQGWPGA